MIQSWDSICLYVGDAVLGWTLAYPRDLVVIVISICLGGLLHAIRSATTDRHYLRQIAADKRRLNELIRVARAANDPEEIRRLKHIRSLVRAQQSQTELLSVCLSLLLLLALATWGQHRLADLPWSPGETVQLRISTPPSAVGEIIHVVPEENLQSVNGWVRTIQRDVVLGLPTGKAEWSLQLGVQAVPSMITIRRGSTTIHHHLLDAQSRPADTVQRHGSRVETSLPPRPYQPLGLIPQQILPGLPGWAALLMLTSGAVVFGLRRVAA